MAVNTFSKSQDKINIVVADGSLTAAGQTTDVARFCATNIAVQCTGTATAISFVVERTMVDPTKNSSALWAPVDASSISGDPATGFPPVIYNEPGVAWWRARILTMTGAQVYISLTGQTL